MSKLEDEYRAFRDRGGLADASNRTQLIFRGADRVRFLNGQLTANIATAKVPSVLPACVTTAKGKLCADVMVTLRDDAIMVDADLALAKSLPQRFERYIVADDVVIEDMTSMVSCNHLFGVREDSIPEDVRKVLMPANRFGVPGFDLLAPTWQVEPLDLWNRLEAMFPTPSPELLELLRIEGGMPKWEFELNENTLPAEAGLDRTHVDFKKGCYIGQEVISRVKSVGHVNREFCGFIADAALTRGARIFTADAPDKDLGTITSAAFSFALDRHIALGYLRRGSPTEGLLAASEEAPDAPVRVTIHPLPFVS